MYKLTRGKIYYRDNRSISTKNTIIISGSILARVVFIVLLIIVISVIGIVHYRK